MTNFDRQVWMHISYANVIDYAKRMIEKDTGMKVSYVDSTFIMAKNTIIDGRKFLIVIPPKSQLKYTLRKKHTVQNLFI